VHAVIKRLLVFLVLLVLGGLLLAWQTQEHWEQPLFIDEDGYSLTVSAGQTLKSVALKLDEEGVYPHPWLIRLYGRWSGLDQQIKRGEYLVPAGTTPLALLQLLRSGKVINYQVTLPEGITLARAIEILAQQKQLVHELDGVLDQRIAALTSGYPGSEGLFFPDSYQYERGASDWDILQRAFAAMQYALDEEWQQRSENLPYQSPYDALVMASIVERETGLPEERSEIAGVFVRRLYQNMRLQTDPTVIYGLGDTYQGNLRRKHLEDESNRYNTYRHKGLPPTPIALPGRAAIHAALHPQDGKTLYFVARGDGGHYFSETLAEHQQAVRKYQLNRRQDYRSSPEKR
jgi:peptidoglycan lytic transglycosylase G